MKRTLAGLAFIACFSSSAFAQSYYGHGTVVATGNFGGEQLVTNCRVVNVVVQPVQQNTNVIGNTTGTILGTIIGGAVGSRFGGGSGRAVATVAGAVGGGIIGNELTEQPTHTQQTICEQKQITGPVYNTIVSSLNNGTVYFAHETHLRLVPGTNVKFVSHSGNYIEILEILGNHQVR